MDNSEEVESLYDSAVYIKPYYLSISFKRLTGQIDKFAASSKHTDIPFAERALLNEAFFSYINMRMIVRDSQFKLKGILEALNHSFSEKYKKESNSVFDDHDKFLNDIRNENQHTSYYPIHYIVREDKYGKFDTVVMFWPSQNGWLDKAGLSKWRSMADNKTVKELVITANEHSEKFTNWLRPVAAEILDSKYNLNLKSKTMVKFF